MIPVAYRSPTTETLRDWRLEMQAAGVSEEFSRGILARVLVRALPRFIPALTPEYSVGLANAILDELYGGAPAALPGAKPTTIGLSPKPATLCAPEEGFERIDKRTWGRDIRFLALPPNGDSGNCTFIGCQEAIDATRFENNEITGSDFERNGVRYVYAGFRRYTSASELIPQRTGIYGETYRLYYWPTKGTP